MTKTPHEYTPMTYEYIRVHTGNRRVTYEQHTGNIRIYAGKKVKVRCEAGTPGTQGTGTPTRQERKKERKKEREKETERERQDKKEKKRKEEKKEGQEKTKIIN